MNIHYDKYHVGEMFFNKMIFKEGEIFGCKKISPNLLKIDKIEIGDVHHLGRGDYLSIIYHSLHDENNKLFAGIDNFLKALGIEKDDAKYYLTTEEVIEE